MSSLELYFSQHLDDYHHIPFFYTDTNQGILDRSTTQTIYPIAKRIFTSYPLLFDVQQLNLIKRLCYRLHVELFTYLFKQDTIQLVAKKIQTQPTLKNLLTPINQVQRNELFHLENQQLKYAGDLTALSLDEFYPQLYQFCKHPNWTALSVNHETVIQREDIEKILNFPIKPHPLNFIQTIEALKGLKINLQDTLTHPIFIAIVMQRKDLYDELLKIVSFDIKDNQGRSLLQYACCLGNLELTEQLLASGIDIHYQTEKHGPALFQASFIKDKPSCFQLLDLLLAKGANINIVDKKDTCLLAYAINDGNAELTNYLLDRGADPIITNQSGFSVLNTFKGLPFYSPALSICLTRVKKYRLYSTAQEILRRKLLAHAFEAEGSTYCQTTKNLYKLEGLPSNYPLKKIYKHLKFSTDLNSFSPLLIQCIEQCLTKRPCEAILNDVQQGKPVLVSTGYNGHKVSFIVWKNYVVICNRGGGCIENKGCKVFEFDPQTLTLQTLEYLKIQSDKQAYLANFSAMSKALNFKHSSITLILEDHLKLPLQKIGNCTFANVEGALLPLKFLEKAFSTEILKPNNLQEIFHLCMQTRIEHFNWLKNFQKYLLYRYLARKNSSLHPNAPTSDPLLMERIYQKHPELAKTT